MSQGTSKGENHSSFAAGGNDVIDLTETQAPASDLAEYTAAYHKEASRSFKPPKRKRQKSSRVAAAACIPKDVDAIDVDAETKRKSSTPSDSGTNKPDYRQVLGPLRMSFVDSFATPHNVSSSAYRPPGKHAVKGTTDLQKLYKELVEYQLNLPVDAEGAIYCRALESNLKTIRVMLTGPLQTPYAAGCFLFDVELDDYPNKAPKVKLLTTGGGKVRFNPNLYNCGKVCLSLLGTWSGPGWKPRKSTLLQVLVSIQGLIMVNGTFGKLKPTGRLPLAPF